MLFFLATPCSNVSLYPYLLIQNVLYYETIYYRSAQMQEEVCKEEKKKGTYARLSRLSFSLSAASILPRQPRVRLYSRVEDHEELKRRRTVGLRTHGAAGATGLKKENGALFLFLSNCSSTILLCPSLTPQSYLLCREDEYHPANRLEYERCSELESV